MDSLLELVNSDKTNRCLVPGNHAAVLQPCDVGIDKSLKRRFKQAVLTGDEFVILSCLLDGRFDHQNENMCGNGCLVLRIISKWKLLKIRLGGRGYFFPGRC